MEADIPLTYAYEEPRGPSWIFTITNNLTYAEGEDSKTVIRLQEPAPSEKFIEIAMYGGDSKQCGSALNAPSHFAFPYSLSARNWRRCFSVSPVVSKVLRFLGSHGNAQKRIGQRCGPELRVSLP